MKKTNKGFSLVELIIVIAIMAILAGALAPALIQYINKSRISTDIQTGNTIATAIQTALSNESAYDSAGAYDGGSSTSWITLSTAWGNTDAFMKNVTNTIGGSSAPGVKSKKCVGTGATNHSNPGFSFALDRAGNKVWVKLDANHLVFPSAEKCLTDDTSAHDTTLGN